MDEYLIPNAAFKRLLNDYNKHGSLVIAFDFDNTVYDFHNKGESYIKVIELLRRLDNINCEIVCWTARDDIIFIPPRFRFSHYLT